MATQETKNTSTTETTKTETPTAKKGWWARLQDRAKKAGSFWAAALDRKFMYYAGGAMAGLILGGLAYSAIATLGGWVGASIALGVALGVLALSLLGLAILFVVGLFTSTVKVEAMKTARNTRNEAAKAAAEAKKAAKATKTVEQAA